MRHFSIEDWADFARNVAGANKKEAMQSHLDDGCKKCAQAFGLWRRVSEVAARQATQQDAHQLPGSALRQVKGLFALHTSRNPRPAGRAIVELLFDSFSSPLLAGVRSAGISPRQLLFGAGDYRLDMRFEPQDDSEKVLLVGQILNSSAPENAPVAVPVTLLKGRKVLAKSATNTFGEFQMSCGLEPGLQLTVRLPGEEMLRITLVEPTGAELQGSFNPQQSSPVRRTVRSTKKSTRKKV